MRSRVRKASDDGVKPYQPTRIVDKMLRNLWLIGYIDLLLPDSCIIHVMRHPLDAGLSCYTQPFGYNGLQWAWDVSEISSQIKMTHHLAAHWDKAMPGRVHTVLYEELVQYPELVSKDMMQWCGLTWSPEVLDFHKVERAVATASVAQRYEERLRKVLQARQAQQDQLGGGESHDEL
eukprot:gene12367-15548_t